MKRLKIFEHIESEVLGRRASDRPRNMEIYPAKKDPVVMSDLRRQALDEVDFRIRIGARVTYPSGDKAEFDHARNRVSQMLAREIFRDMTDELLDLQEWVFEKGIGRDVEDRIGRLIKLSMGETVEERKEK